MKHILFIILISFTFTQSSFAITTNNEATNEATNDVTAILVIQNMFNLFQRGEKHKLKNLFLSRSPEQEQWVTNYIEKGVTFFSKIKINNTVLEIFMDSGYVIGAVEQTSTDKPGLYEIEPVYLLLDNGYWRIIPYEKDHRSKLNKLTEQEKMKFDVLRNKFQSYKLKEKEDRANKVSQ